MTAWLTTVTSVLTAAWGWSVGQHVSYDGSVTLVAEHGSTEQTFTLSGSSDRVELARLHSDELTSLGVFSRVENALDVLVAASPRAWAPTRLLS